jgi:hypothetical protein
MKTHPKLLIRTLAIAAVAFATLVTGAVLVPTADAGGIPGPGEGLTDIRVGRHVTYDRIVLDFHGPVPRSFHASWVPVLTADGSGNRVALPGRTFLAVAVQGSSTFDVYGRLLYHGAKKFRTPQLRNVVAVAITGDFERVLGVGIGVRHRAWVHVFTLTRPSRLVIDIGR